MNDRRAALSSLTSLLWAAGSVVTLLACGGSDGGAATDDPDAATSSDAAIGGDVGSGGEAAPGRDTGSGKPGADGGGPAPDGPAPGGDTGGGADAGVLPPLTCGAGAACAAGQVCDELAGRCVCVPGFAVSGADCVRPTRSDPTARTKDEVCAHWKEGHVETAKAPFVPGAGGACDPGKLPSDARLDAVRRWNMYRWLSGLHPAGVDPSIAQAQQECALIESKTFGHDVPTTAPCYTADGAKEASLSMIAQGFGSAASTMDAYMFEPLSTRLAHRKISISVDRDNINFGFIDGGSCARYGYGFTDPSPPAFVAVPNPGVTPLQMTTGAWSLHGGGKTLPVGAVKIFDETDKVDKAVAQDAMYAGYNAWTPSGWTPQADHTYRVTLTDAAATLTYAVTPVDCP